MCWYLCCLPLNVLYLQKSKPMSSKHSWTFFRSHWPHLGLTGLLIILYYWGFLLRHGNISSQMGLILGGCHCRLSLGDNISMSFLFSAHNWLTAGWGVLLFPLSQVRKCLILYVALQYLKYQIMFTTTNIIVLPNTVKIITNQFGITKDSCHLFVSKLSEHVKVKLF